MAEAVFIDTSVFLNLLDVPHLNADRTKVADAFRQDQRSGVHDSAA